MSEKSERKFIRSFLIILVSLVIGTLVGFIISQDRLRRDSDFEDFSIPDAMIVRTVMDGQGPKHNAETADDDEGSAPQKNLDEIGRHRNNAIVNAAGTVGPCVVSINVFQTQIVQRNIPFDDFWSNFFSPRRYRREVQSLGSGFIISGKGHILTNEHVVQNATRILVTLEDGREYEATVIGSDERTDLALLRIDEDDLPIAPLGDSDNLILGEWLIAIGNPFGYLLDDPQPTVTVGVVSALNRDIKPEQSESRAFVNMIQTDASINPGNSGGPLVDSSGRVVGVNTFILSKSGGSLGMGFAVPINRASRVVRDLVKYGNVRWPWIGIHPQELTGSLRDGLKMNDNKQISGVIVADIDPGSPAEKAGFTRGDIITDINGKKIRSVYDWDGEMTDIPVGKPVKVTTRRQDEVTVFSITTEFLPTDVAKRVKSELGITMTDLSPEVRSQIGASSEDGAVVIEVVDPQLEQEGGILPFDVILKINNETIQSAKKARDILNNLQRGNRHLLIIERDGKLIYRSLITR